MNTLKILKLIFDNRKIEFKSGINYILGTNGSGKTTIFNLIPFVLGLKKDLGFFQTFLRDDSVTLEISISGKIYLFTRDLFSREVQISSDGTELFFNVTSIQFNRFLNEIFEPRYEYEVGDNLIVSLLKESFISEIGNIKILNTSQKELKLLLLGINWLYPKKIKSYLKELTIQLKQKEDTISQIKSYKSDVEFLLVREFTESKVIGEILQSTLGKYTDEIDEVLHVLNESTDLLRKINNENDQLYRERRNQLNPLFKEYLNKLSIDDKYSIEQILDGVETSRSYGKHTLISLLFEIILQSNPLITNGIGLIVNDAGMYHLDNNMTYKLRSLLQQITTYNDFQYIEFITDPNGIDKNEIVFDLSKNIRYA